MEQQVQLGYCNACAENTGFAPVTSFDWTYPIGWFTSRLNMGPWYCEQCLRQVSAVNRPLDDGSERVADDANRPTVSVGNFIRGDGNLVVRNDRSNRFSDKFRAGVVQRVLDGKHSLREISEELELPQADLLIWVAEQFTRKQKQIDEQTRLLQEIQSRRPDLLTQTQLAPDWGDSEGANDPNDVIEGHVVSVERADHIGEGKSG